MVSVNDKSEPIEKIAADAILYITLLNRELNQLNDHKMIKTFVWLKLIDEYKQPSISNMGRKINVSKSQMTSRIDDLVKKGLIERINDEVDRRIIRIKLTSHGNDYLRNTQKTLEVDIRELIAPLNLEERKEFERSIQTIKNTLFKIKLSKKES